MKLGQIIKGVAHVAVTTISAAAGAKVYTMAKNAGLNETQSTIIGAGVGAFAICESNSIVNDLFKVEASSPVPTNTEREETWTPRNIIVCQICGHGNDEKSWFCSKCGCPLSSEETREEDEAEDASGTDDEEYDNQGTFIVCPICGYGNSGNNRFCTKCGCPLDDEETREEDDAEDASRASSEEETDSEHQKQKETPHGGRTDRMFGSDWRDKTRGSTTVEESNDNLAEEEEMTEG